MTSRRTGYEAYVGNSVQRSRQKSPWPHLRAKSPLRSWLQGTKCMRTRSNIASWMQFYNNERPHQSLNKSHSGRNPFLAGVPHLPEQRSSSAPRLKYQAASSGGFASTCIKQPQGSNLSCARNGPNNRGHLCATHTAGKFSDQVMSRASSCVHLLCYL